MTPLHHSLIQLLLPACIETTGRQREKPEPPEVDKALWDAIKEYHTAVSNMTGTSTGVYLLKLIAAATKRPEMLQYAQQIAENAPASIGPHYDPLTVIILEHNGSNHAFQLNKPYIIINGKNFRLLHDSGKTDNTRYSAEDKPRLATDEEIEKCLEDLNAAQLRKIMTHELFAPIVHKMYEAETELVAEEQDKGEPYVLKEGWNYYPCNLPWETTFAILDYLVENGYDLGLREKEDFIGKCIAVNSNGIISYADTNNNNFNIIPEDKFFNIKKA
jgi:hypothetical protein